MNAFVSAILLCVVLNPLNSSTISVALPILLQQLHTDSYGITWIVSGYYIGSSIAQPIMGKLGDQWGRARFVYFGLMLMIVTALLAPLSRSLLVFVCWRIIQAVGTSMIYPNAIGLLREHREREVGKVLGWIGMVGGISIAIGPTVGGLLVDWISWHAIFWLNIPLCVVAGLLLWKVLPRRQAAKAPDSPQIKQKTDWTGSLLFTVAVTAWLLWSDAAHPFSSQSIVVLVAAGLFTIALVRVEWGKNVPMIPVRWFRDRQFALSSVITVLANLVMYCILYGLPVYLQTVHQFTASKSGLFLLIFAGVLSMASPLGGYFAQGRGRKGPLVLAGILLFLGTGVIWWASFYSLVWLAVGLILVGVSFAIINIVIQQIVLESVPSEETGQASGIYTMLRYLGTIVSSVLVGGNVGTNAGAHALFTWLFLAGVLTLFLISRLRVRKNVEMFY